MRHERLFAFVQHPVHGVRKHERLIRYCSHPRCTGAVIGTFEDVPTSCTCVGNENMRPMERVEAFLEAAE